MTPLITIGSIGLDAVHVFLLVAAIGMGVFAWTLRGSTALIRRDLKRAEEDLADTKQALKTQQEVARQAEIALAEARARSAEEETKFAQLAQGVLQRANTAFLERADETFKRHLQETRRRP